ncbi:hypothetical protein GH714_000819 [Hevea brasiliensis]|uniref:Nucleotide-diphospho-sugar transferase domain-containing protein n=1 Tax=Hevea brasiliensis TaxID=3981 RepID=A0A6A6M9I6_HEVBR|nr:hypothetical protein GH714_000819 [Hevea brasiliensis]
MADHTIPLQGNCDSDDLESVLRAASMKDKTVILTSVNIAMAKPGFVLDVFLESFKIGNNTKKLLNHLVIITLDQKAYARCLAIHPHCFALKIQGLDLSSEAFFMTPIYLEVVWAKIHILATVLQKGYNFVFTDADVMWVRDPFPHFYEDADFCITRLNDQDVFNKIKYDPFTAKLGLQMKYLDTAYFGGFCEFSKDFNKVCTMHANCCIGRYAKSLMGRLLSVKPYDISGLSEAMMSAWCLPFDQGRELVLVSLREQSGDLVKENIVIENEVMVIPECGEGKKHSCKRRARGSGGNESDAVMVSARPQSPCSLKRKEFSGVDRAIQDLGFLGYQYTWDNRRGGNANIQEHLDHFLADDSYAELFGHSLSNHSQRFRFEEMWVRDESCMDVIRQSWDGGVDLNRVSCGRVVLEYFCDLFANTASLHYDATIHSIQSSLLDELRESPEGWDLLLARGCWKVGSGDKINVWTDNWLLGHHPMKPIVLDAKVGLLINRDWKVDVIWNSFLPFEQEAILRIPLSNCLPDDEFFWPGTRNGVYLVKFEYRFAHMSGPDGASSSTLLSSFVGWKLI